MMMINCFKVKQGLISLVIALGMFFVVSINNNASADVNSVDTLTSSNQVYSVNTSQELQTKQKRNGWKTWIIKKAAQLLAAKLGSKSAADIANYLTGFEDDLQSGIQSYLTSRCGWNSNAAYWTAKSIIFAVF
ncbi:hypothetical protein AB9M75_04525 [Lactobacillus sp. AN1001]